MFPTNSTCTPDPASDPPVSIQPVDSPSVSSLLKRSRAHHQRKTELANKRLGKQHVPNYQAAEAEAAKALELRLQAHDLDPDHLDPEWANDPAPHAEIVAFLQKYESIP